MKARRTAEAIRVRVGQGDVDHPLDEHWEGTGLDQPACDRIFDGWLNAISCESKSNCEAVGYTYLGDESEATLAMRMRGSEVVCTGFTPGFLARAVATG